MYPVIIVQKPVGQSEAGRESGHNVNDNFHFSLVYGPHTYSYSVQSKPWWNARNSIISSACGGNPDANQLAVSPNPICWTGIGAALGGLSFRHHRTYSPHPSGYYYLQLHPLIRNKCYISVYPVLVQKGQLHYTPPYTTITHHGLAAMMYSNEKGRSGIEDQQLTNRPIIDRATCLFADTNQLWDTFLVHTYFVWSVACTEQLHTDRWGS